MTDEIVQKGSVSIPVTSTTSDEEKKIDDFLLDNPEDPMNDTKKEIRTRFELLPSELQKVIVDDAYRASLLDIARTHTLTYDELGTLEIETTMVLLGMTKPADYRKEIQEQLKKNDAESDSLVKDINEKVFAPVRAALEKLYSAQKDPVDYLKEDVLDKATNPQAPGAAPVIQTTPTTVPTGIVATAPKQTVPMAAAPALTTVEKSVLEKTGVVISETAPTQKPVSPMTMPSRADVLKGIENPTRAPSAGLVADKLSPASPIVPPTKSTDYTVPKPVTPPITPIIPAPVAQMPQPTPKPTPIPARPTGPDPYREPID